MTEEELAKIEREAAVGWTLPGRADAFALVTITNLVAEVRRLRAVEREARRVVAAIVARCDGGLVAVPEAALREEYTLERERDVVRPVVWFSSRPVTPAISPHAEPADQSDTPE